MAYRAPRYSYVHAARDVGADAISLSQAAHADFPIDNLIDDRAGTQFKFAASNTNPFITVDLGAGFDTGLERVIIPPNHNLTSIRIGDDDDPGWPSVAWKMAATACTPGSLVDIEFDSTTTQRYLYIGLQSTAQHYLSQLCLTKIMTLDVGPVLSDAPDWKEPNTTQLIQPTGARPTIQHGPDQRYLEYPYEYRLSDAGASTDLTDIEAFVAAVGMHLPFFVDPASFSSPAETDEPALWMKFADIPRPRLAVDIPTTEERSKIYTLQLIESLD